MLLDRLKNEHGQIWLNVASSHYPVNGFVNLDNHIFLLALDYPVLLPFVPNRNKDLLNAYRQARKNGVFVRHDCRKPLPVPNGVVDHILCSHFLEHVYLSEGIDILKDFRRALKPGATLHVIVPDLEAQARTYLEGKSKGSQMAADQFVEKSLLSTPSRGSMKSRLMEAAGGFGLKHCWMYDRDSMRVRIEQCGFSICDVNDTPSQGFREGDDSVHIIARKPENAPQKAVAESI